MIGENVVFTEKSGPHNYLKLIASDLVDETMLEALEDYGGARRSGSGWPKREETN